jgi:hypothetical protein
MAESQPMFAWYEDYASAESARKDVSSFLCLVKPFIGDVSLKHGLGHSGSRSTH